ncbi:MAG TPA: c-type cytochrome [Caulobacteraceae bacterium]|nr:c-type cytochrome [Caulobacteraceae bacterium]
MRRPPSALACLAVLALAACSRPTGGRTSAVNPAAVPADAQLRAVPLGQPPGEANSVAATIANPYEGDAAAVADGKALFSSMNCVYCHGDNGSGLIGPALNSHGWRYGGAPAQLYNSIHDGRPQGMPAWGARLPPDQIWKLVAYLESLGGAKPPATRQMVDASTPSTTGPQVNGQSQEDTAHEALVRDDAADDASAVNGTQ